jgi:hypothetical protein
MVYKRDYAEEYRKYQGTPEQLHNQSLRHQARRAYEKAHPGVDIKGKDIDHMRSLDKGGNPLNVKNLRVSSQHANRDWRKEKGKGGNPRYGK